MEGERAIEKANCQRLSFSLSDALPHSSTVSPSLFPLLINPFTLKTRQRDAHRLLLPVGCVAERGGGEEGGGGNCDALHDSGQKRGNSAVGAGKLCEGTAGGQAKQASEQTMRSEQASERESERGGAKSAEGAGKKAKERQRKTISR